MGSNVWWVGPDAESSREMVRPVWMKAEDVLPAIVGLDLVLAHTDAVAIALSGLWCYPNGFEFGVSVVLREPDNHGRLIAHRRHMGATGEPIPPEFLRLGLQFSNGTKLTNMPAQFGTAILFPVSATADSRSHRYQYWVWPLPPPGPLAFVCEWPHFQIGQTEATIDAGLVLDAAARAVALWPET
ncbi:MAG TPA: hypothetical protein VF062_24425 [Candidatus Limnocylindrales bacterium]